jgi:hypothetical protein
VEVSGKSSPIEPEKGKGHEAGKTQQEGTVQAQALTRPQGSIDVEYERTL